VNSSRSVGSYEFRVPGQIVFGWGQRRTLGRHAPALGNRAWILSGSRTLLASGAIDEIRATLKSGGVDAPLLTTISREPWIEDVDDAARQLRREGLREGDFLLAIGGGAALDLGKAVAAMATQPSTHSVRDYLEGIGRGLSLTAAPLRVLAMPTTAGTGSEATKNAVISSVDPPVKKSLRFDEMLPRLVVVDPELGVTAGPEVTSHSGMDAVTQLVESYLSRRATAMTRPLCLAGLRLTRDALLVAYRDGQHQQAREAMAQAALLSGMALANSGLGMAHGVAAALGVHKQIGHGLACAVMLPVALAVNGPDCGEAMIPLAEALTGQRHDDASSAVAAVGQQMDRWCEAMRIPRRLRELGVTADDLPALVRGSRGNSMNGNPRELSDDALHQILEQWL
jgi:alcohol dehydrogenase class IV